MFFLVSIYSSVVIIMNKIAFFFYLLDNFSISIFNVFKKNIAAFILNVLKNVFDVYVRYDIV